VAPGRRLIINLVLTERPLVIMWRPGRPWPVSGFYDAYLSRTLLFRNFFFCFSFAVVACSCGVLGCVVDFFSIPLTSIGVSSPSVSDCNTFVVFVCRRRGRKM